jgi:hypothetical protein
MSDREPAAAKPPRILLHYPGSDRWRELLPRFAADIERFTSTLDSPNSLVVLSIRPGVGAGRVHEIAAEVAKVIAPTGSVEVDIPT